VHLQVAGALGAGHVREWTAGRRVRAPAGLRRPQVLYNFGGASPFWQEVRRPFVLAGSVKSAALVEIARGTWAQEAAARVRWRARDAASRFVGSRDRRAAAVAIAILIGDRAGLDDETMRGLQRAGTYHVIAISGGNVALLTGLVFVLCGLVLRSPRVVAGAALVVTLAYGAVVAGEPSVARAVTAAALYLGARCAGLTPSPLATLRTTACVLAALDPLVVVDVGAWLSFGATAGIILLAGRVVRLVPWPDLPRWFRMAVQPLALLVSATIAAEIVLLPIAALAFGRVTVAGVALNVFAIPAMAIVQVAGLVVAAAGPVLPVAGHAAGAAAVAGVRLLMTSATLAGSWPWLWWRVPAVSIAWVAAYYAAAWLACRASGPPRVRQAARLAAIAALGIVAFAPAAGRARPQSERLRITAIDVGQGDATLVQFPNAGALLVDAGGRPGSFDLGSRVLTPAAWALGARAITWLAITHPDLDHIGGAVAVADDLAPREIWEGVPVPRDPDAARLREFAEAGGLAWRQVLSGARLTIGGRIDVEALHPPAPDWERQRSRNDDSLVLRIRYGLVDVLLTGDAGDEFERRLPADLGDRPIRILKVGHHGSRTSTSARLVEAMRPHVAIVSVGRGNLFGQPAREVLDRLSAAGARLFRTDRDGAVSLETDGRSVRIRTALGGSWMVSAAGAARGGG
jgi:competence protein ComEC